MKITHDFHIHTSLSYCANETATVDNYIEHAKRLGLKKIGFANHFWDENIDIPENNETGYEITGYKYYPQSHLAQLKPELQKVKDAGIQVFYGCEVEYDLPHRGVSITEAVAETFDFILMPNSHTHMTMPTEFYHPYEKHIDFMFQACEDALKSPVSRYITAMAHPFMAVCAPYDRDLLYDLIPDDRFRRLFDAMAEKGIAFEINTADMEGKTSEEIENGPSFRMFRLAKECGCQFLFGSDAHSNSSHNFYENASIVAKLLGLTEKDLLEIAR